MESINISQLLIYPFKFKFWEQLFYQINNKKTILQPYDTLSQEWMRSSSPWSTVFEGGPWEFYSRKVSLAGFVLKYKKSGNHTARVGTIV